MTTDDKASHTDYADSRRKKATDFYVDYLGFHLDWKHHFDFAAPLYMQISREQCTIHLSEHHGD